MKALFVVCALFCSLVAHAETKSVTLSIPTMDCATCPILIRTALERVNGVTHARVSYKAREAKVTYDTAKTNLAALVRATANVGYPSFEKD